MAENPDTSTPAKRRKLAPAKNPYFTNIGGERSGLALGYRKLTEGPGTWTARLIENKRRAEKRIGPADDAGAPAGALSFIDAGRAAVEWADAVRAGWEAEAEGAVPEAPTVKQAVEEYVRARKATATRDKNSAVAGYSLQLHVLEDPLAAVQLTALRPADLKAWIKRRPAELAPSTVQRIINDLKAALLAHARAHAGTLPATWTEMVRGTFAVRAWAALRPERKAADRDADTDVERQIMADAEVRAIVAAAFDVDPDFGRLVMVLAATGIRFSQAIRLRVRDVDTGEDGALLNVPPSHKGRSGKKRVAQRLPIDEHVFAQLRPVLNGRTPDAPLLERNLKRQVSATEWAVEARVPWKDAGEMVRPWRAARAAAGVRDGVTPYGLRHSRIVALLRARVPAQVVANALDTSTAVIDSNYGRFSASVSADLLRAATGSVAPNQPQRLRVVGGATE